ncbi:MULTISPECIES: hypothetical protein [unclassified Synechococcus]|nr:hypothetical protein [Synechococcus sp. BIOS-E4-1]
MFGDRQSLLEALMQDWAEAQLQLPGASEIPQRLRIQPRPVRSSGS